MEQMRRSDSESVDGSRNLVGVVLADKSGYKANRRVTVKPKFTPAEHFVAGRSSERRLPFFSSYFVDLSQDKEQLEFFRVNFNYKSVMKVKQLLKHHFGSRFNAEWLKKDYDMFSRSSSRRDSESPCRADSRSGSPSSNAASETPPRTCMPARGT